MGRVGVSTTVLSVSPPWMYCSVRCGIWDGPRCVACFRRLASPCSITWSSMHRYRVSYVPLPSWAAPSSCSVWVCSCVLLQMNGIRLPSNPLYCGGGVLESSLLSENCIPKGSTARCQSCGCRPLGSRPSPGVLFRFRACLPFPRTVIGMSATMVPVNSTHHST